MDFVSPEETAPGTCAAMLEEVYTALRDVDAVRFAAWRADWRVFDQFVYGDAPFAGNWMFFLQVGGQLAGFVSWDPRERPKARIGHNCIRPQFQGKGYGVAQLAHALDVLRAQRFDKVVVQTGAEPFFAPARAMYERAGFQFQQEVELTEPFALRVVDYELVL